MRRFAALYSISILVALVLGDLPAAANDITAEWSAAKPPPVPVLKDVTVDPKTTALLVLDLMKPSCGARPRCVSMVPAVRRLLEQARAHNMMVHYTLVGKEPTPANFVDPAIGPKDGEWSATGGPDKFYNSPLEARLKSNGIKTVIVCGTSAQGAVVGTGSEAAERGYAVVVPVDCMSSEDLYDEQYAAWHMYKGGPAVVVDKTTVTRSDLITFGM
jgi:nicotinamidase-related amidase